MLTHSRLKKLVLAGIAAVGTTLALALGWTAASDPSQPDERYYMLMFGSQSDPNVARLSHTFAVFAKATGDSETSENIPLETHCISWMPRSLEIEPLRMSPVPGANLDLPETLSWARSVNSRVTMWGPYPIKKELYDMGVRQAEWLNTIPIRYLCIDHRLRGQGVSNCIHAVTDLDTTQPALDTGNDCGNAASELALQHFRKYIIVTDEPTQWLVERLGLREGDIQFATKQIMTGSK